MASNIKEGGISSKPFHRLSLFMLEFPGSLHVAKLPPHHILPCYFQVQHLTSGQVPGLTSATRSGRSRADDSAALLSKGSQQPWDREPKLSPPCSSSELHSDVLL